MKRLGLTLILVMALVAAGCGSDDDDGDDAAGENTEDTFEIATFNAGLARGFVDYAEERAPLVFDELADLPVDVVVVNEVWAEDDVAALEEVAADAFPNSVFMDPMPDGDGDGGGDTTQATPAACPIDESQALVDCVQASCAGTPDDELVGCVLGSCGTEFAATSGGCQSCLAANIGKSFDEIVDICVVGTGGDAYAYGGTFGIGLLSSEPIVEQDSLVMDSSLTRRGVIYAQIDDPALGTTNIFVTHLTANLDLSDEPVPYPGEDGSWAEEQAAQIDTMHEWIDGKTSEDEVTILLGDMNTSPEGDNYTAETPDNYEKLVEGDWIDAYVDDPDAECTYCDANPLVGRDGDSGPMLDHILVENFDGSIDVVRILEDDIDVEVDGETVTTALSDHYGLTATLTP